MDLEYECHHAQKRWSWEFEDLEKTFSWGRPLKVAVEFFKSWPSEINWDLEHNEMRRAWGGVSIVLFAYVFMIYLSLSLSLSLSPLVPSKTESRNK